MFTSHFYYANYACKQSRSIIKILDFVHLWSKEVPVNISYPSTVNQIYGCLDTRISPNSVRYIITRGVDPSPDGTIYLVDTNGTR